MENIIEIYLHVPGTIEEKIIKVPEDATIQEVIEAAKQVALDIDNHHITLIEDSDELLEKGIRLRDCGVKHRHHLHCRPNRHETRIHIDRERHNSPLVTTGAALYAIGNVTAGRQLYREARGVGEDEPIFNDQEIFHMVEDTHFYSTDIVFPGYKIHVRTREKTVHNRLLTFEQIIDLAYTPRPTGGDILYTVSFHNAAGHHHEGEMVSTAHSSKHGEHAIKVKNGTIIDVEFTDRS